MAKRNNKRSQKSPAKFVLLGLVGFGLLIAAMLQGKDVSLFNPKGQIAGEQFKLMMFTAGVLLEIAIPTILFLYFVAWRYREANDKAAHEPNPRHGKLLVFGIWAVPVIYMLILASVMWPATHRLAPQKDIASSTKPLTIKVIAMRWKWLFIYPEQQIATVNFVQVPIDTPVQFDITADEAPMSSFWISHLGGQLYAMTGHVNRLNLMAETPGDYTGRSAEINGAGFAGMTFTARASTTEDFSQWVENTKQSSAPLTAIEYKKLLVPSENNSAVFYSGTEAGLYATMLAKYEGSHDHHTEHE